MRKILAITLTVAGLAGCNDPKAPSNQHFAKALNDHFAKNPACIDLYMFGDVHPDNGSGTGSAFPARFSSKPAFGMVNPEVKQADAFVSAGLLIEQDTVFQQKLMFGSGTQPIPVRSYDLTDKGRAALAKPQASNQQEIFGNAPHFCYGTPEVVAVERYTQPASMMGFTVSHVIYTYHLKDVPDWARDPAIAVAFPEVQQSLAGSTDGSDDVVLTSNGWAEGHEAMR